MGVGVTVGVGVLDGVAGTGVKVARRVAVGLGVSVAVGETPATAVAVGGWRIWPQPAMTRLARAISHTRHKALSNATCLRPVFDVLKCSLP
jgi:hypothetical protein